MTLEKKAREPSGDVAERADAPGDAGPSGTKAAVRRTPGRPRVDGTPAGAGNSPAVRLRVTEVEKRNIHTLMIRMNLRYESEIVRAALDEYFSAHLDDSADATYVGLRQRET